MSCPAPSHEPLYDRDAITRVFLLDEGPSTVELVTLRYRQTGLAVAE